MNDEQVMEVGGFIEALLSNPNYQFLCATFEQQLVEDILTDKPAEPTQRDKIAKTQGFREFLQFLALTVQRHAELNAGIQPDHQDPIDNPDVHNIFDFEYVPESNDN